MGRDQDQSGSLGRSPPPRESDWRGGVPGSSRRYFTDPHRDTRPGKWGLSSTNERCQAGATAFFRAGRLCVLGGSGGYSRGGGGLLWHAKSRSTNDSAPPEDSETLASKNLLRRAWPGVFSAKGEAKRLAERAKRHRGGDSIKLREKLRRQRAFRNCRYIGLDFLYRACAG